MDEDIQGIRRCYFGGITSLTRLIDSHGEAIEADLMVYTGKTLEDLGGSLSWRALKSFLFHLPMESATRKEIHPDAYAWSTTIKTNAILADIFDMLSQINANLVAMAERKPARKIKHYPRLGKKEPEDGRRIGSGALPVPKLEKWFEEKRMEYQCRI